MGDPFENCLAAGEGIGPVDGWSHPLEGRLTALALAWESERAVAADDVDSLYVFDRDGQLRQMTRGYADISDVAISADGERIMVVFEERRLALLDSLLQPIWRKTMYDKVLGAALDPFGRHLALGIISGRVHIMTTQRQEVAELELRRPIPFLRFATTHPYLIAAAADGLVAGIEFLGRLDWEERLYTTSGDLAIDGAASRIFLAGFAHGLQCYNDRGDNRGTFIVEGSPARVSTSFSGGEIAVGTLEGRLYLLGGAGDLRWLSFVSEEIVAVCLNATGQALTVGLAQGGLVRFDWQSEPEREEDCETEPWDD